MGSPKRSSYAEEYNSTVVVTIIIYPLHFTGVKLMELKKEIAIKDSTTNNIPSPDIRNDPYMLY